jgi:hypothetical protein
VNFGGRGKSSERHSPTSRFKWGFDRVFDPSLTTSTFYFSRGSIGVVGSVFEVMTQVDLGLTNVSRFDSADSVISINDAN